MDKVQAVADMFKPKFFNGAASKKGETFELKAELNADTKDKRKDAVKRVIANMTVGKDVSMLFADVVKNMQTEDLELKKLVYLYLINYAKSQPELVILAVNTFVKDADEPNPLIRALAIRTMGCLRVQKILDYISEPLRKGLKDDHPYVRKTAALCVSKLYDLSPTLCIDNGFITTLQDLLSDPNPMVIANSVAALLEIREASPSKNVFVINAGLVNKLLTALNECTEWGQISILEALALYVPVDSKEAEQVAERVMPRLQHNNASVVMSAVKVLVLLLDHMRPEEAAYGVLVKKLTPPLVTLLSSPAEVQYVALRNINLVLQRRPEMLSTEMRVFFCKYNDPPYVKLEKLEIIIKLASDKNVDQVIGELKEYANEVDVDFVRKSVRAIGRCAIKIDSAAERCVGALLDLMKNKVNYVVQEAIIVIKDIFRKYPNRYEAIIPALCENLESLDEPEAKASMIWIVGEYAQKIENAQELVEFFLETFKVEPPQVQLQLLTTTVKLFLKKPQQAQELVQKVLQTATTTGESADLRDKAYIYWRLLSSDPQAAIAVVLADKPAISVDGPALSPSLLQELTSHLCTVASVYHKPPSAFLSLSAAVPIQGGKDKADGAESDDEAGGETGNGVTQQQGMGDLLDLDFGGDSVAAPVGPKSPPMAVNSGGAGILLDLMGDDAPQPAAILSSAATSPSPTGSRQPAQSPQAPGFGGLDALLTVQTARQTLLSAQLGKGLEVSGYFLRKQGAVYLHLSLQNKAMTALTDFAIQFNKNSFAIVPAQALTLPHPLPPGQSHEVDLPLAFTGAVQKTEPANLLQMAMKNNVDVFYFQAVVPVYVLFTEGPAVDQATFMSTFKDAATPTLTFNVTANGAVDEVKKRLSAANVSILHQPGATQYLIAAKLVNGMVVVCEWNANGPMHSLTAKSRIADLLPLFKESVEAILAKL